MKLKGGVLYYDVVDIPIERIGLKVVKVRLTEHL